VVLPAVCCVGWWRHGDGVAARTRDGDGDHDDDDAAAVVFVCGLWLPSMEWLFCETAPGRVAFSGVGVMGSGTDVASWTLMMGGK